MSDSKVKSNIGKDAVFLTSSRIITLMITFVTSILLARFRTLGEYGTYSQIIMVIDLVTTILLLGLPNSINYFLSKAENEEMQRKFMSLYLTLSTILNVLISICLIGCLPLIVKYFNNPDIKTFAYVFLIIPWSTLMINSIGSTFVVIGKTKELVYFSVIQALVNLGILLLAKFIELSFSVYLFTYVLVQFLFALISVLWTNKALGGLKPYFDTKMIKSIFVYSIPMGLASVVGTLNVELDKLVIGRFFSTEEYALFTNAAKELPLTMFASSITAVLLPALVRLLKNGETNKAMQKWKSSISLSFCVMALFCGGLVAFSGDVMTLLYSAKYVTENSIFVFRIYAIVLLFRCTYWGIVLNATGRTKFILWSSVLTLVLNLFGNIVFYYLFGFIGPAISTLIVTFCMNAFQLFFTVKCLKTNIKEIIPFKNLLIMISETIILGVVFYVLRNYILSKIELPSLILSLALGIVWAVIYLALNIVQIKKNWKRLNQ